MKDAGGDLRFALRMLRKDKVLSAVAVATLALAIGANTAVFSLVDAIVLRPLAYRDAGRLVALEAGLSAMCLIGGGLLQHSFVNLLRVDGGFRIASSRRS